MSEIVLATKILRCGCAINFSVYSNSYNEILFPRYSKWCIIHKTTTKFQSNHKTIRYYTISIQKRLDKFNRLRYLCAHTKKTWYMKKMLRSRYTRKFILKRPITFAYLIDLKKRSNGWICKTEALQYYLKHRAELNYFLRCFDFVSILMHSNRLFQFANFAITYFETLNSVSLGQ